LDAAVEGFAVTCYDEEALKLVEDSTMTVGRVVDMYFSTLSYLPPCNYVTMNGSYLEDKRCTLVL
jgi:hypothetical protein